MKYLASLFALLIFLPGILIAQWTQVPIPGTYNLRDVAWTSEGYGCLVGTGVVLETIDDGVSWSQIPSGSLPEQVNAVQMVDDMTGYMVGTGGTILARKWVPGTVGIKWHALTHPSDDDLEGVFFISGTTGWVCGHKGFIGKTTDAGQTWIEQYRSPEAWRVLYEICFLDSLHGFAVGSMTLETKDGGLTWVEVDLPSTEEMRAVHFVDEALGFIVGRVGTILRTADGGESWSSIWSTTGAMLMSIDFGTGREGWIVGGGVYDQTWHDSSRVLHTTDAGLTWGQVEHPTEGWLGGVVVDPRGTVWAVGGRSSLIRHEGVTSILEEREDRVNGTLRYFDLLGREVGPDNGGVTLEFNTTTRRSRLLLRER